MLDSSLYRGREQTYIKHLVLKSYLQKLAYKKGRWGGTLNYIDCFAGPWQHADDELKDTSPFIAIDELRAARDGLLEHSKKDPELRRMPLRIRCLFIERDPEAWALLSQRLEDVEDVEVEPPINGEFEGNIEAVLRFASATRTRQSFSFFFIDPTGWTGYALNTIAPVLRHQPGEVLINFMTRFVIRFIDSDRPEDIEGFTGLFASEKYRARWAGLKGLDREDAIVQAYCDRVREVGGFKYVARSTILDPLSDRTHFDLIYGTRHIEGLRVFRNDAERPAGKEQEQTRWQAHGRRRSERDGQIGLFDKPIGRSYSDELRDRYHGQARDRLMTLLEQNRRVDFDRLEEEALLFPLMNTQEVKNWLVELEGREVVKFEGLAPRGRIPQPGKNHVIVLL